MTLQQEELLAVALAAARNAGSLVLERLADRRRVTHKGYRDLVTDADLAAETVILSTIRAAYPGHAILSEEAGAQAGEESLLWLIDPLDGTTNYARGHPTFAVSVAVLQEQNPVVGVIHDPLRGHTFAALRGGGATVNGRSITVSPVGALSEALVALDWSHDDAERARVLRRLATLAPRCRTIRALGSAALAMAYVGAGWLDVYFAAELKPWDSAAAALIIQEGGGRISTWDGGAWTVGQPALLATNGRLQEAVLDAWAG